MTVRQYNQKVAKIEKKLAAAKVAAVEAKIALLEQYEREVVPKYKIGDHVRDGCVRIEIDTVKVLQTVYGNLPKPWYQGPVIEVLDPEFYEIIHRPARASVWESVHEYFSSPIAVSPTHGDLPHPA